MRLPSPERRPALLQKARVPSCMSSVWRRARTRWLRTPAPPRNGICSPLCTASRMARAELAPGRELHRKRERSSHQLGAGTTRDRRDRAERSSIDLMARTQQFQARPRPTSRDKAVAFRRTRDEPQVGSRVARRRAVSAATRRVHHGQVTSSAEREPVDGRNDGLRASRRDRTRAERAER